MEPIKTCRSLGSQGVGPRMMRAWSPWVMLVTWLAACAGEVVRPVVIYRGLNSTCCAGKARELQDEIRALFPGIYVHSVQFAADLTTDRLYSIFDSASDQVARLCQQLSQIPALRRGFNAIGLSQGGLLMRAYVQRCNQPPVYNLITLGAPMDGITRLPGCHVSGVQSLVRDVGSIKGLGWIPDRLLCRLLKSTFQGLVYTPVFQHLLLPAQYYRVSAGWRRRLCSSEGDMWLG